MAGRGESRLGAGDVEPDDAVVAPPHRDLGDLARSRLCAHGREQRVERDRTPAAAARSDPSRKPSITAPTTSSSPSSPSVCSSGANRTSAYTTPSAARSSAHSAATRIKASRVCITAERVVERFEVEDEVLVVRARHEPLRELVDIGRRQPGVAARFGELDHRRGPHTAIEVIVQQGLRRSAERLERGTAHAPNPRSGKSSPRCSQLSLGYTAEPSITCNEYAWRLRRAVRRRCSAAADRAAAPTFPPESRGAPAARRRARAAAHRSRASNSVPPPAARSNSLPQRALVTTGLRPQAAVLERRVLEREPEADDTSSGRCRGTSSPGDSSPRRRCSAA